MKSIILQEMAGTDLAATYLQQVKETEMLRELLRLAETRQHQTWKQLTDAFDAKMDEEDKCLKA